jgi:TorA maturation chaperone TorD
LSEQRSLLLEEPFSSVAPVAARELEQLLARLSEGAQEGPARSKTTRDKLAQGGLAQGEPTQGEPTGADLLARIQQDYTYLFYLVSISHTSPYESVYRTETRELLGPSTLAVREQYRAEGLAVAAGSSLPDDHIGFELNFLERLFERLAQELEAGEHAKAQETTQTIRRFLGEHLLVFAPAYLRNFQARAQTDWYRATGALAQATVALLAKQLDARAVDEPFSERGAH